MTIEEAIVHAEEAASDYEGMIEDYWLDSEKLAKCANEQRQLAEWLKELAERRKQPEIIYCKDCRKHNVKVGFDENLHTVWKEDACPLVNWRGKAKQHEFDYQYCTYAERRNDV